MKLHAKTKAMPEKLYIWFNGSTFTASDKEEDAQEPYFEYALSREVNHGTEA